MRIKDNIFQTLAHSEHLKMHNYFLQVENWKLSQTLVLGLDLTGLAEISACSSAGYNHYKVSPLSAGLIFLISFTYYDLLILS